MMLNQRLARLEASTENKMMGAEDRGFAIERYAAAHHQSGCAFPNAMSAAAYRHAIETAQNPVSQRLLACWLPGDEDL